MKQLTNLLENLMAHYVDSTLLPADQTFPLHETGKVELVYGEAYDMFGLTIDSLKYYLFLTVLKTLFSHADGQVMVGDVASIRNKGVREDLVKPKIEDNIKLMAKIKSVYSLPITFVRMSTVFTTDAFQKKLKLVQDTFVASSDMKDLAKGTVMRNRLKQEDDAGFQYSLEEVALILEADIKIGAMRELNYDKMANIVREGGCFGLLRGVYLKPTHPLGVQFDYFLKHPEIEKYGLTPYKAGSNKLQANRVILGVSTIKDIADMAKRSFNHEDVTLPNAVRDLFLITLLAEACLLKDFSLLEDSISYIMPDLETTIDRVEKYIYQPLGLE